MERYIGPNEKGNEIQFKQFVGKMDNTAHVCSFLGDDQSLSLVYGRKDMEKIFQLLHQFFGFRIFR